VQCSLAMAPVRLRIGLTSHPTYNQAFHSFPGRHARRRLDAMCAAHHTREPAPPGIPLAISNMRISQIRCRSMRLLCSRDVKGNAER
jgi:hypothetical protein